MSSVWFIDQSLSGFFVWTQIFKRKHYVSSCQNLRSTDAIATTFEMNKIRLWFSWHEMVFFYLYLPCKIFRKILCQALFVNCVLCCPACLLLNPCISWVSDIFVPCFTAFQLKVWATDLTGSSLRMRLAATEKRWWFCSSKSNWSCYSFFQRFVRFVQLVFCILYFFFKHCADIGVNDLSIPAQSRKIDQRVGFVAWILYVLMT